MNNRESANKVNPNYLPLSNYYGRPVDTTLNYNYANGVQVVPVFSGVSYDKPNYNSLSHGSCVNHATADKAYIAQNCVQYKIRLDGPSGSYYEQASSGPSGPSGPDAPMKKENYAVVKPKIPAGFRG